MTLVVAMDSFKGALDARAACAAVARGIAAVRPDAVVIERPMADGGEGTGEVLQAVVGGRWTTRTVTGPLPDMRVEGRLLMVPAWGPGALVEFASAAGIERVPSERLDPMRATSRGVGELIRVAVGRGARVVRLGLGGSATVDGGVGMARALGWRFLDAAGDEVAEGGGGLSEIRRLEAPADDPLRGVSVEVLCDVENPLVGPEGAAAVFGPQKGATAEQVRVLDAALARLAQTVERELGFEVAAIPRGGAAGGAGAGAVAFLGARLLSGVEAVMEATRLDEAIRGATHVLTGEGRFDAQSLHGKVVSGVAARARRHRVPVTVLAGRVAVDALRYRRAGIDAAIAISPNDLDDASARAQTARRLEESATEWAAGFATP